MPPEIERSLQQRAEELRPVARELQRIEAALQALQRPPQPSAGPDVRARVLAIVTATPGLLSVDVARAAPDLQSASVKRTLKALQADGLLQRDEQRRWAPSAD